MNVPDFGFETSTVGAAGSSTGAGACRNRTHAGLRQRGQGGAGAPSRKFILTTAPQPARMHRTIQVPDADKSLPGLTAAGFSLGFIPLGTPERRRCRPTLERHRRGPSPARALWIRSARKLFYGVGAF